MPETVQARAQMHAAATWAKWPRQPKAKPQQQRSAVVISPVCLLQCGSDACGWFCSRADFVLLAPLKKRSRVSATDCGA